MTIPINKAPSKLAMVPFVSVDNMMKIINSIGVAKAIAEISIYIEKTSSVGINFDKTPRVAAHSNEG